MFSASTITTHINLAINHQKSLLQSGKCLLEYTENLIKNLEKMKLDAPFSYREWKRSDLERMKMYAGEPYVAWMVEHGMAYEVPEEITDLLDEGILEDISYRNETCPRFRFGEYGLWVEHPDEDQREHSQFPRFTIMTLDDEGCDLEEILSTDELDKILSKIHQLLPKQLTH